MPRCGGCCAEPPPRTVVVAACPSSEDAGVVVTPEEAFESDKSAEARGLLSPCARACSRLSVLGCPESRKPAGGRTCVETCRVIARVSSFDPKCVEAAINVETVRTCPQVRCLK